MEKEKITVFKQDNLKPKEYTAAQLELINNLFSKEEVLQLMDKETNILCVNYTDNDIFIEKSASGSGSSFNISYTIYCDKFIENEKDRVNSNNINIFIDRNLDAFTVYNVNISKMNKEQVKALGVDAILVDKLFAEDKPHPQGKVSIDFERFTKINPDFDLNIIKNYLVNLQNLGVIVTDKALNDFALSNERSKTL